jgi:unsaturated chondroitin disaccharide hydrolase
LQWDFDAEPPNAEKDTSAASIAASAYLELYKFTGNQTYMNEAVLILSSLGTTYLSSSSEAVLSNCFHDCGSVNCTIVESDYYFYEALRRYTGLW